MKRFWAFIAACLFLLLTACGGSTSTTEPVWQAELPNTGITVQVSGCTLERGLKPLNLLNESQMQEKEKG